MCCSGSCTEAFSKLNNGIYYHNDSAIYVNSYVPSKVYWKKKKYNWNKQVIFLKNQLWTFNFLSNIQLTFL